SVLRIEFQKGHCEIAGANLSVARCACSSALPVGTADTHRTNDGPVAVGGCLSDGVYDFTSALGKVNLNAAPRGLLASAHRRPPWASMMDRQIDSPMPVPLGFVV